jgi:hypothetical protein
MSRDSCHLCPEIRHYRGHVRGHFSPRRASHQVTIGGQPPPNALGARNYALASVVMAGERGHLGDELATVNPLVDGGQRNLGLTSDSSQFVCHRIECAQRV